MTVEAKRARKTPSRQESQASRRFFDNRNCPCAYSDPILIACPKCQSPGVFRLRRGDAEQRRWKARRFFGCETRGHSFDWKPGAVIHSINNWDKILPLVLQTPCCGKNLCALNKAHLEFIEIYAGALIRERSGAANASLASRLPQWIKSAKNREVVLKAVAKLKQLL
jgi:hypothetical protein